VLFALSLGEPGRANLQGHYIKARLTLLPDAVHHLRQPMSPQARHMAIDAAPSNAEQPGQITNRSREGRVDRPRLRPEPASPPEIMNLPTGYTLRHKTTGETKIVTDPGRALITGKWKDIGRFKGPILRGLAGRAPYFHNGSAATLADVVNFYDQRFALGLSEQQKSDLVAFLRAL
jgi:cytochrome c peroxidase